MLRDGQVHVSSFCTGGTCLGVSLDGDDVVVTDEGSGERAAIRIGRDQWAAFLAGVKAGEFDLPTTQDP